MSTPKGDENAVPTTGSSTTTITVKKYGPVDGKTADEFVEMRKKQPDCGSMWRRDVDRHTGESGKWRLVYSSDKWIGTGTNEDPITLD